MSLLGGYLNYGPGGGTGGGLDYSDLFAISPIAYDGAGTFSLDIPSATSATPVLSDTFVFGDTDDSGNSKKATLTALRDLIQSNLAHQSIPGSGTNTHLRS